MPNINPKQNRRESLISKIYAIYDAKSCINKSHDVDVDSRRVIDEALQTELALTKEILKQVETESDEENDNYDICSQVNRITYLC